MSVRRDTKNRRTLYRTCGICGREFMTSAGTPWVRQMPRDGKKQATTYFCSQSCYAASYKHIGWYDGKTEERRAAREAKRDISAKNKLYYQRHQEQEKKRARDRYWANPEGARADNAYCKKKRRLINGEVPFENIPN